MPESRALHRNRVQLVSTLIVRPHRQRNPPRQAFAPERRFPTSADLSCRRSCHPTCPGGQEAAGMRGEPTSNRLSHRDCTRDKVALELRCAPFGRSDLPQEMRAWPK
jgi:hypothetical protein